MLRVYRIFTHYTRLKPKIYTSTYAHFVYTFLIVSPTIIILLMWTVIDPYKEDIKYVEHRGFLTVKFDCTSKYFYLWTTLTIVYTIFLSLVVVTVAVKSRNIRMKQFKDTKKVNMFIFLFIFSGLTLYA